MEKKRVIVTGGGASGLMAAIAAAENGAAVTILEQNEKPGKKICATGNGKCNFTNIQVPSDAYRSENPGFEQAVLNQFPVEDTVKFFTRLGIYPVNISILTADRQQALLRYCVWKRGILG